MGLYITRKDSPQRFGWEMKGDKEVSCIQCSDRKETGKKAGNQLSPVHHNQLPDLSIYLTPGILRRLPPAPILFRACTDGQSKSKIFPDQKYP